MNYSADETNEGIIHIVCVGSEEPMFTANMSGTAQLPHLSEGTHYLTITEGASLLKGGTL
ncbi:MAG TPA: hypothetical protein VLU95_03665 [Candidatus Acidoferrum sp.]|nr:hypothetical protein [Candidatus Acidoferrum sp.]